MSTEVTTDQRAQQRQQENDVKLGLLLVSLGITPKEKLFGSDSPSVALKSIGDKGVYSPIRSGGRSTVWYNPLSWFARKDAAHKPSEELNVHQRSHTRHDTEASALSSIVTEMNHNERSSTSSSSPVAESAPLQPGTDTLVALAKKAAIDAANQANRRAPDIDFRPMNADEVSRLMPSTQADRTRMLGLEETIHAAMDNIESTKHQFLTPSRALECEAQVDAVVECFHRVNLQLSAMESETILKRSRVALNCGASVDRLRACTNQAVSKYALQ